MAPTRPVTATASADPHQRHQRTHCLGYRIILEAIDGTKFDVFVAGFADEKPNWHAWLRHWNSSDRYPLSCRILAVEPWQEPLPIPDSGHAYTADEF